MPGIFPYLAPYAIASGKSFHCLFPEPFKCLPTLTCGEIVKLEVLFDRKGRHTNQYIGRSIYNQSVFTTSKKNLIGKINDVSIIRSTDFALEAII